MYSKYQNSRSVIFNLFHLRAQLITKILQHAKKYIFCRSDQKISIILIHWHQVSIVVLAVFIFLSDSLRERRSVPQTKLSGITCFKNSCRTPVCLPWPTIESRYIWSIISLCIRVYIISVTWIEVICTLFKILFGIQWW